MIVSLFHWATNVLIASRCRGGVAIMDKSRMPDSDIFRVRGIGVAVMVNRSTWARRAFNFSLWRTPNRCSSSIITRPRSLYLIASDNNLCVPIKISILPSASCARVSLSDFFAVKRVKIAIRIGQSANRSRKFW